MSKKRYPQDIIDRIIELHLQGLSSRKICIELEWNKSRKSSVNYIIADWKAGKVKYSKSEVTMKSHLPKVLVIDIETCANSLAGYALFNQNFGLDQIENEWFITSYAAKWLGSEEVMYDDMQGKMHTEDDTHILQQLWNLFDTADVVVGQNSRAFDIKKINARLIMNGFPPYSPFKTEDTLDIAKRRFKFTSNKLEWLTDKLNVEFKKLKHSKFAGYSLWKGVKEEDPEAWIENKEYNIHDTLSTEELWLKLRKWDDRSVNFALYLDDSQMRCTCGSENLEEHGYAYTSLSKFRQYHCKDCGSFVRGRKNLFSKEKRASLIMNVTNR